MKARPHLLALYLLALTCGAFFVSSPWRAPYLLAAIVFQLGLLAGTGKLTRDTWRAPWRLKYLFLFLIACYTLLPGAADDRTVPWLGGYLAVNLTGLQTSLLMCGQLCLVVLVSYFVRVIASPNALVEGLLWLRMTPTLAYALDSTLGLLEGAQAASTADAAADGAPGGRRGGRGGGRGGGGGRGQAGRHRPAGEPAGRDRRDPDPTDAIGPEEPTATGRFAIFRHAVSAWRVRIDGVVRRLDQNYRWAAERAKGYGLDARRAYDVGVIASIAAVMMSLKMFKVLPGIPIASGFKNVLFIPLYIVAAHQTHSRFGATMAGTIMGVIGFLNGDGRYGVFEVAKHIAPGLAVDVLWPFVRRHGMRVWMATALCLIAALVRTSTEFLIVLALGARWEVLAFPVWKLIPNLIAGWLGSVVAVLLLLRLEPPGDGLRDGQPQGATTETPDRLQTSNIDGAGVPVASGHLDPASPAPT